jgi:ribonuclease HII
MDSLKDFESLSCKDIKYIFDLIKSNYKGEIDKGIYDFIIQIKSDKRKNVSTSALGLLKFLHNYDVEISRVQHLYEFDKSFGEFDFVAGVDEVGRGPLAGPIVGASVILDSNSIKNKDIILGIKDSKKLLPNIREELTEIIKSKALCWNIHELSNTCIDNKGIAWCNNEVLKNAAEKSALKPQLVISDGYAVKGINIRNEFVIKGDAKSASIACASIIAKVYRDKIMRGFSHIYENYGFEKNSGYGTAEHIAAIKKYGLTEIHRKSFLTNIMNTF